MNSAAADSGVWRDQQSRSRWQSVVVRGQVREIHERIDFSGANKGMRRYEFDSVGKLRRYSERVTNAMSIDQGADHGSTLVRESTIEFLAGLPALATREINGTAAGFQRIEMRRLQSHGYALLDSARKTAAAR